MNARAVNYAIAAWLAPMRVLLPIGRWSQTPEQRETLMWASVVTALGVDVSRFITATNARVLFGTFDAADSFRLSFALIAATISALAQGWAIVQLARSALEPKTSFSPVMAMTGSRIGGIILGIITFFHYVNIFSFLGDIIDARRIIWSPSSLITWTALSILTLSFAGHAINPVADTSG